MGDKPPSFREVRGILKPLAGRPADPYEIAARAICEADPLSPAPDAPIMWGMERAKAWEPRAAILRQAVGDGLFCHPPKAWLAKDTPTP